MAPISESRKAELLQTARRTKLRWILSARDESTTEKTKEKVLKVSETLEDIFNKIPAASCVQTVLDYFNMITDEGEELDLNSLLLTLEGEEDELDELVKGFNDSTLESSNEESPYNYFLRKLLSPQLSTIVQAIRKFTTRFLLESKVIHDQKINKGKKKLYSSLSNSDKDVSPSLTSAEKLELSISKSLARTEGKVGSSSFKDSSYYYGSQDTLRPLTSVNSSSSSAVDEDEREEREKTELLFNFLDYIHSMMIQPTSSFANDPKISHAALKDFTEKFVFTKLYHVLYNFSHNIELKKKNNFSYERILSLSFLSPEHLDIKSFSYLKISKAPESNLKDKNMENDPLYKVLLPAIQSFQEIFTSFSPTQKLLKLKQSISNIASILKNTRKNNGDNSLPGADELLPVMILVILFVRPKEIHSEVKFLSLYTRSEKLLSEAGYLLTTFISAVSFIDSVDKNNLTIDPEEFERNIEICKRNSRKFLENKKQEYEASQKNKKMFQENVKTSSQSIDFSPELLAETKQYNSQTGINFNIMESFNSTKDKNPEASFTSIALQEYLKASKEIEKKNLIPLSQVSSLYTASSN